VEIEDNVKRFSASPKTKSLSCAMISCMTDGGRSSGEGLQEQLPNRPELHMLRAFVVSVIKSEFPAVEFERYADDVVVHCKSLNQAAFVLDKIRERLGKCGLELNIEKTKIVYCKDSNRKAEYKNTKFTFLGYTFRARRTRSPKGKRFKSFSPWKICLGVYLKK